MDCLVHRDETGKGKLRKSESTVGARVNTEVREEFNSEV